MILYWDRSIITDRTVDFNRPIVVLINRENKTALVIDIAVPLPHNLPKTEAENVTKCEIWPWKSKISEILTASLRNP
jgi:hypothetical protein